MNRLTSVEVHGEVPWSLRMEGGDGTVRGRPDDSTTGWKLRAREDEMEAQRVRAPKLSRSVLQKAL